MRLDVAKSDIGLENITLPMEVFSLLKGRGSSLSFKGIGKPEYNHSAVISGIDLQKKYFELHQENMCLSGEIESMQ